MKFHTIGRNNSPYTTTRNYYVMLKSVWRLAREDARTSAVVYLRSEGSTWACEDLMNREQTSHIVSPETIVSSVIVLRVFIRSRAPRTPRGTEPPVFAATL